MPQDSSQEKTEQPTPKRLRDARKKGQTFKSRDMDAAMVLIAAFAALAFSRSMIFAELKSLMEVTFGAVAAPTITTDEMFRLGSVALFAMIKICAPVLVTAVLTAGIVSYLQVGPVFSFDPLKPQLKKLNAIENLKNMFKPKAFVELFKNLLKIGVVFLVAYSVLKGMLEPFLLTMTAPVEAAAKVGGLVIMKFMLRMMILFITVAIIDFYLQRREYMKNLKMTKEEVKREYKEDEGDPLIKARRRQIHMEMAMTDVGRQVKASDVVVTNPTHLAIAIKYDREAMAAPQIMAKGQRLYAEHIRAIAEENGVPLVRNIPLAWSLIELEIGDEIPERLYVVVAEILAFVYRMKEERSQAVSSSGGL